MVVIEPQAAGWVFLCDRCAQPYRTYNIGILVCPACLAAVVANA